MACSYCSDVPGDIEYPTVVTVLPEERHAKDVNPSPSQPEEDSTTTVQNAAEAEPAMPQMPVEQTQETEETKEEKTEEKSNKGNEGTSPKQGEEKRRSITFDAQGQVVRAESLPPLVRSVSPMSVASCQVTDMDLESRPQRQQTVHSQHSKLSILSNVGKSQTTCQTGLGTGDDGIAARVQSNQTSHDGEQSHGGHKESHGHGAKHHSILTALAAAIINFLLMFGLCCAYGMIMFSGDHNKEHRPLGVKINLCTSFITGLSLSVFSRIPVAIGGPDLNPVVFLGGFVDLIAKSIAEEQFLIYPEAQGRRLETDDGSLRHLASSSRAEAEFCQGAHLASYVSECEIYHKELRATVVFAVAVSSALLGLVYFLLGRLRLTRLVQYLPSSITEAFLSCIGYKVFKFALQFCNYEARQFVPAALVGVPLYFMKAMHIGNPAIVMPLGLLVPVGIFYGIMYTVDPDFDPITNEKVMFPEIPNVEFWKIWTDSIGSYESVNLKAWFTTLPDLAIMLVVCMLDCVLKISATEDKLPIEVDKDFEISLFGATNLLNTMCGGSVGYMQLKFNVISYGVMGNVTDRRAGAIYAVLCGVCFFGSIYLFNYLPRFFLTALLFFAGAGFVAENMWGSRKYLSFYEWLEILLILFVFIVSGQLLYAVAVGILLCGFSFVRKYASVPVLCGPPLTGRDICTRERRNPLVQRAVDQVAGTWLLILRLKGFIFFGSASTVTGYVMHRIKKDKDEKVPAYRRLKYVCFDCEFLDGLDASAGKALNKMIKEASAENVIVIWSSMSLSVRAEMQQRQILGFGEDNTKWFPDLNGAVLHVENQALRYQNVLQEKWLRLHTTFARYQARMARQMDFEPFLHVFLYDGPRVGCPWKYCDVLDCSSRAVLWKRSNPSTCLYLVHTGAVGIFSDIPQTSDDWKTPMTVYRHGWFLNTRALANSACRDCAVCLERGQVLSWSTEQWRLMAREQPLMMHELMRALLRQRVEDEDAGEKEADNLHMDMDNHDWEAFTERVDHLHQEDALSHAEGFHSPRSSTSLDDGSEFVVHRVGDWSAKPVTVDRRLGLKRQSSFLPFSSDVPEALKVHLPALQTAQALGRIGFYKVHEEEAALQNARTPGVLPREAKDDLLVSFHTFRSRGVISSADVGTALMYAGIFEEPCLPAGSAADLTEEQFLALGRDMMMAKMTEADVANCRQMFTKYDDDSSGSLDVPELSTCFAETIHPNVSAEEVESLADAWAHDDSGHIGIDAFVAIMTRFVQKHKSDWDLLRALHEIIGADSKEVRVKSEMLMKRAKDVSFTLTEEEAKEMLWAACGRKEESEDAEEIGIDLGAFLSAIFVFLGRPRGLLPPPPRKENGRHKHGGQRIKSMPSMEVLKHPDREKTDEPLSPSTPSRGVSTMAASKESDGSISEVCDDYSRVPPTLRARIHLLLEEPRSSPAAMYTAIIVLVLICISVFVLVLEPLVSGQYKDEYSDTEVLVWDTIEVTFTVFFSLEILARACVCNALGTKTFWQWLIDPGTLCDIAAVLPYFTDLLLHKAGDSFKLLRLIRLIRLGRVMRVTKTAGGLVSKQVIEMMQPATVVMVVIWGIYLKK